MDKIFLILPFPCIHDIIYPQKYFAVHKWCVLTLQLINQQIVAKVKFCQILRGQFSQVLLSSIVAANKEVSWL